MKSLSDDDQSPSGILYYLPFQGGTSESVLCVCLFWCQFLYCFHLLSV